MLIRNSPPVPCASFAPARQASEGDPPRREASPAGGVGSSVQGEPGAEERGSRPPMPAAWFRDHVDGVWRVVARLGVPVHSVDDVVQEAFIIASRRRADISPGQERNFLVATAVRLCSNYRRKAHVRREVSRGDGFEQEVSPSPNAEQLLIERRWRELLDQLLAELSDAHRAPFVLYELEGLSVPEIAQLLELPLGTVSSRLWRARSRFSELAASLQSRVQPEER
jgi:RNA polymerase sigma-70 factor (ECF subfamily)